MLRTTLRLFCALAFMLVSAGALAQEFSADVVDLKGSNLNLNKIYVGKDKVRVNANESGNAMGPGAIIIDEAQKIHIGLIPQQHMYMEIPMTMYPRALRLFHVSDVNDACPQWKAAIEEMKGNKYGTCTKLGSDSLNGRSAVKYQGTSTDGKTSYIWVDTKLHCVVKTEDANSSMELRNIKEGAQPASLFEIPSDYTKFDMGSMMQRGQYGKP